MTGIYDWEFDGSVNFAPYEYRMKKYEECEELGDKIKDEDTAVKYLKAFSYIDYLSSSHFNEIPNWNILVGYEEMALSLLTSKEKVFEYVIYPQQHQEWKEKFDNLRDMESKVMKKETTMTIEEYQRQVLNFNKHVTLINKANKEIYNSQLMPHNLYWVNNRILKHDMRKRLDFPQDFDEKIDFLELHGVLNHQVDYRRW